MDEYSVFIITLKKMYGDKKIELSKIQDMLSKKKITKEEYNYIISK